MVGHGAVDVVISTSAFHALPANELPGVYRRAARALRAGGVLLNGDTMPFASHETVAERVARAARERREADAFARRGVEDWDRFRAALQAEPAMAALFAERERRFAYRGEGWRPGTFDEHLAAAREAGFGEVSVIWQHLDNRVLLAVR
jgi:hypothetical protein